MIILLYGKRISRDFAIMADILEVSVCALTFVFAATITRPVLDAKSARHCSPDMGNSYLDVCIAVLSVITQTFSIES